MMLKILHYVLKWGNFKINKKNLTWHKYLTKLINKEALLTWFSEDDFLEKCIIELETIQPYVVWVTPCWKEMQLVNDSCLLK